MELDATPFFDGFMSAAHISVLYEKLINYLDCF